MSWITRGLVAAALAAAAAAAPAQTAPAAAAVQACTAPGGLQRITATDEPGSGYYWCGTPPACLTVAPGAKTETSHSCSILQYARREPRYDRNGRPGVNYVRDPQDLVCDGGLLEGANPSGGRCPPTPPAVVTSPAPAPVAVKAPPPAPVPTPAAIASPPAKRPDPPFVQPVVAGGAAANCADGLSWDGATCRLLGRRGGDGWEDTPLSVKGCPDGMATYSDGSCATAYQGAREALID